MSTYQRTKAGMLAVDYARAMKVDIDDVVIEYLEDDDAEIWAPGTGVVWTINGKPSEITLKKAR